MNYIKKGEIRVNFIIILCFLPNCIILSLGDEFKVDTFTVGNKVQQDATSAGSQIVRKQCVCIIVQLVF